MEELFPGIWHAPNHHPLFVHAPVTLLPLALAFLVFGEWRDSDRFRQFGRWCLWIGVAAMLAAVGSGLWAAEELGHDAPGHEFVHTHRDIMLVATGLALASAIMAWVARSKQKKWASWLLIAVLSITNLVVAVGADRGGELVFRFGTGTVPGQEEPEGGHPGGDHEH